MKNEYYVDGLIYADDNGDLVQYKDNSNRENFDWLTTSLAVLIGFDLFS